MSSRSAEAPRPDRWSDPRLLAPTEEAWAAMSPAERDAVERRILDVLDEYRRTDEHERAAAEQALDGACRTAAEMLLQRLAARGLAVSDEQRQAVMGCDDIARLLRWMQRVESAATAGEVLAG